MALRRWAPGIDQERSGSCSLAGWVNKAPSRTAASHKRSSRAVVSTALPPDGIGNRNIKGRAKTIPWVLYEGEANRVAKTNKAQAIRKSGANQSAFVRELRFEGERMDIEAEQRARLAAEMYASHIEETREMNARHLAEMRKHERRGIRFANFGLVEAACQTS